MDHRTVSELANTLQRAAIERRCVSYQHLHSHFARETPISLRYCTLEQAAQTLCDLRVVDYGAMMALDNGLPGDDFFARFKYYRRDDYLAVMGHYATGRSITKRRLIADTERRRVFTHAITLAQVNKSTDTSTDLSKWPQPKSVATDAALVPW